MNGSDLNSQLCLYYTTNHHYHRRNWWPLFLYLLNTAVINAYYLYKETTPRMTHREFQKTIAYQLLYNPLSLARKRTNSISTFGARPTKILKQEGAHTRDKLLKRGFCKGVCSKGQLPTGHRGQARTALQETSGNIPSRARYRGKNTINGCRECQLHCCLSIECWKDLHSEMNLY